MVHMPSLEIWEWGLKIFAGAPTLTTHVGHLLYTVSTQLICTNLEHKPLSLFHVTAIHFTAQAKLLLLL